MVLVISPTMATAVQEVVASRRESCWQRLTFAERGKGLITCDCVCQRVVESRDGLPERDAWLLPRRSFSDLADIAYSSSALVDTPPVKLAQVVSTRSIPEQCIEESKGETSLDECEVRFRHNWHRHITPSMMAHSTKDSSHGSVPPWDPGDYHRPGR